MLFFADQNSATSLLSRDEVRSDRSSLDRIPSLDGLRAIAIVAVIAGHFSRLPTSNRLGWLLHELPFAGVLVFFVLSGFLITHLLIAESRKTGTISLGQFYLRRAFRILPSAYLFLAVVFLIFPGSASLANKIQAPLFLENYALSPDWNVGHFWTLGVEEQFYLLWPVIFLLAAKYRVRVLVCVLCAVPVINLMMIYLAWPFRQRAFWSVADELSAGCLLAMLWATSKRDVLQRALATRWFWLCLLPLGAALWVDDVRLGPTLSVFKSLIFRPLMTLGVAAIIARVVTLPPLLLNAAPIRYLGRLSYSLYLWQQVFAHAFALPWIARIACPVCCAMLSFHLVEQPFLRLRARLVGTREIPLRMRFAMRRMVPHPTVDVTPRLEDSSS